MIHRNLIASLVALVSTGSSGLAHADETPAELMERVSALRAAKQYAEAATLADESARRDDLEASARVALGGLARQNYELSFSNGGPPSELCKAAAILRHVAPFDPRGGAAKLKAADDAEKKLAMTLGSTWRTVCSPEEEQTATTSNTSAQAKPAPIAATSAREPYAAGATESPRVGERPPPPPAPSDDRRGRRHVRAGVGTLVSGLVLFAPMAGLLAYRAAGERDLAAVDSEAATRPNTETDYTTAAALSQRYMATTAGAIVLGVTGAALVVTGAALLGAGTRQRRMAVTPWGSREAGGLVLRGRF